MRYFSDDFVKFCILWLVVVKKNLLFKDLNLEIVQNIASTIQESIRHKCEEISLLDSCCLQLVVPVKSRYVILSWALKKIISNEKNCANN